MLFEVALITRNINPVNLGFDSSRKSEVDMLPRLSRSQWLVTAVLSAFGFFTAMCVSMQAPFFPAEAAKKGCTPTGRKIHYCITYCNVNTITRMFPEYGFVFGCFQLTMFVMCPVFGVNLHKMDLKVCKEGNEPNYYLVPDWLSCRKQLMLE